LFTVLFQFYFNCAGTIKQSATFRVRLLHSQKAETGKARLSMVESKLNNDTNNKVNARTANVKKITLKAID